MVLLRLKTIQLLDTYRVFCYPLYRDVQESTTNLKSEWMFNIAIQYLNYIYIVQK